jgi:hypothetical protein
VEFYFSESNLPRDRFLRAEVAKASNGAVSLALVCSFSRMRALLELTSAAADVPADVVAAVAVALQAGAPTLMLEQPDGASELHLPSPLHHPMRGCGDLYPAGSRLSMQCNARELETCIRQEPEDYDVEGGRVSVVTHTCASVAGPAYTTHRVGRATDGRRVKR